MKFIIKTVPLGLFLIICLSTQQLKTSEPVKLTPLHTAVLNLDDKKVCQLLEDKKAKSPTTLEEYINATDAVGENALWYARQYHHPKTQRYAHLRFNGRK